MKKDLIYWNEAIYNIFSAEEIVVYGAGVMGKALKTCLQDEPYDKRVSCFLVSDLEDNPKSLDNIPVMDLEHADQYKENLILVALHEKHMEGALKSLREGGFLNVVPVSFDSDAWSDIRGNWLSCHQLKGKCLLSASEHGEFSNLRIYVVHSAADRRLKEDNAECYYEIPIQVGAALADEKICPTCDDQGDNISHKNKQYCELTALYWIWKNDKSSFVGLSHYRRKFKIGESLIEKLLETEIDAFVTVPVLNFVGVRQQYCADHEKKDWDIMLEAMGALHPEYLDAADRVQNGIYYYAYNMFITRRDVLDAYCSWLFPILSYCEEKIGEKTDGYQNRYIGFLAERLMTIFFEHNKQYKLAVIPKHFIESA